MVRFKNRYLLCIIDSEDGSDGDIASLHARDILTAVRSSLSTNFGDLAVGQSIGSLAVKLWSPALAMCIIRCSRDHFRTVWGATTLITAISGRRQIGHARFSVIHVGGTIRSCQKSAAEYARGIILAKKQEGKESTKLETAALAAKREIEAMDT